MIVCTNSSPLITLARVGQLDLLRQLFQQLEIADEVYQEVVVQGAGRPASMAVGQAAWIKRDPPADAPAIAALHAQHPLGMGEIATVLLVVTLKADLAIIDDRAARQLARAKGILVMGCIGILESAYRKGYVTDLRALYMQLLSTGMHVNRHLLNHSLHSCGLPTI